MLPSKNLITHNLIAFSIIAITTGCSKSYQSKQMNDLSITSLSKASNSCTPTLDENFTQDDLNDIETINEFFQPELSDEELSSLNEALIQNYKRDVNEIEPITQLLIQLEDYMHKYGLKLNTIHNRNASFIDDYIKGISNTYINTMEKISNLEESSIIKYKSTPVFGVLKNDDFSIEKYIITLEAEEKVSQFKSIMKNYMNLNNLNEDYIPLPNTFKTGGMRFINRITGEEKFISYNNDDDFKILSNFNKYLNENVNRISSYVKRDFAGKLHLKNIDSAFGLRAGLGIKTIFDFMSDKRNEHSFVSEGIESDNDAESSYLY
ncbi:hypothetical protein [Fluviispira sanaruensis]|uniref:Uncharacterized protein n=1 Tax=Fluviispira sanaruensis TaxID=2493639 RepID=A0A4P2VW41_FLUSA|nr:hypothetical protein [Fluviispira sanaruensis]BBH53805.1 hypothetical protein JCM31447_22550 [Fluviispira sanaruensis]